MPEISKGAPRRQFPASGLHAGQPGRGARGRQKEVYQSGFGMSASGLETRARGIRARKTGLMAREIPDRFCIERLPASEIPNKLCIHRLPASEIKDTFCMHRLLANEIPLWFCIHRLVSREIPNTFCIHQRLFFKTPFFFNGKCLPSHGNKVVFRAGGRHFCRPSLRMAKLGVPFQRTPVVWESPGFRAAGGVGQGRGLLSVALPALSFANTGLPGRSESARGLAQSKTLRVV